MPKAHEPFPIEHGDTLPEEPKKKRKVEVQKRKPRFQALNDDMIWIAETDIARLKRTMEQRDTPLTDKEHSRFIRTAEQLRKLRLTDAELNKMHDPNSMAPELVDEEFDQRCEDLGLDPALVLKAFGL